MYLYVGLEILLLIEKMGVDMAKIVQPVGEGLSMVALGLQKTSSNDDVMKLGDCVDGRLRPVEKRRRFSEVALCSKAESAKVTRPSFLLVKFESGW